jgi:hypothetical protein
LGGQSNSLNEGGGKVKPPAWSKEHAIIWVIYDLPAGIGGFDLMNKGSGRNAGMYKGACLEVIIVRFFSCWSRKKMVLFFW